MGADTVDRGRRNAFGAGAVAIGALLAATPKEAEAAHPPLPFLAIQHAQAVGDGITDDTAAFRRFDAAGGGWVMPRSADGTIFYIAGNWTPTHQVIIGPGAVLKLGAGASVTLAEIVILDDTRQCFDTSSGGTLSIAKVNRLSPYHFGAAGNGTADDTAACAAAMKAAPRDGEVRFPQGIFAIGANLPKTRTGVTIRGERARLVKKAGTRAIHFFTAATGNRFLGLNLTANEASPFNDVGSFGIYNNINAPASDVEIAHCVFNDIRVAIRGDGAVGWNIHDNSGAGFFQFFFAAHSTAAPIARLRIVGNNVGNTEDAGMAIDPVRGNSGAASLIEVSNNIVQDTNLGAHPSADGYAIDMGEAPTVGAVTDVLIHGNLVRQITPSRGTAAQRGAISISAITRASVRDNICIGVGGTAGATPYCYGIVALSAVNSAIADNEVSNFIADGIHVWGTTGVDVLDNLVIDCGSTNVYAGISLNNADSGVTTNGCRVKGNRVVVQPHYANAATAVGIYLVSNRSGAARCSGIEIDDNTVEGIGSTAIMVQGGGGGEECLLDRICNNRIVKPGLIAVNLTRTIGALVQGNTIRDAPVGIFGSDNTGLQILGNHIRDDGGTTTYYIEISGTNAGCNLIGNVFESTASHVPYVHFAGVTALRNQGYATENSGTASIAPGASAVTVKHGLAVTPSVGQISVTPNGNIAPATHFWISGIGPAGFTINLNAAPAARVDLGWSARLP
jgi:hypothetical protein